MLSSFFGTVVLFTPPFGVAEDRVVPALHR